MSNTNYVIPTLEQIPLDWIPHIMKILEIFKPDELAHLFNHGSPETCDTCERYIFKMPTSKVVNNYIHPIWMVIVSLAYELEDDDEHPTVHDLKSKWKRIVTDAEYDRIFDVFKDQPLSNIDIMTISKIHNKGYKVTPHDYFDIEFSKRDKTIHGMIKTVFVPLKDKDNTPPYMMISSSIARMKTDEAISEVWLIYYSIKNQVWKVMRLNREMTKLSMQTFPYTSLPFENLGDVLNE